MKRRITFIHEPNDPFDPKQLDLQKNSLQVTSLKAAREERWTTSLSELPQEVRLALKQLHELRIRWASARPYSATAPFASSIPPGLHVFLTPQRDRSATLICPLLAKIFGGKLDCTLPEVKRRKKNLKGNFMLRCSKDTFTHIPITAGRFASSASLQHHETSPLRGVPGDVLHNFIDYIVAKLCIKGNDPTCEKNVMALEDAIHIDVDYDTISQTLSLSAFLESGPTHHKWNEQIEHPKDSSKIEVGILANEKASNLQEISLGGYLIILGEDTKAKPTLFSFPSRHHLSQSNFTISFANPTGLHPALRLTFPAITQPNSQSCALHTYLTLPSSLFPDKYQLAQTNLLKSNNLAALRSLSPPAPDLEAPVWAVKEWGSTMLLELAPPSEENLATIPNQSQRTAPNTPWHADIPLHLRYLPPSQKQTHSPLIISNPIVFWACPSSHTDGPEFDTNPFDRTNLGYDGLFGSRTLFHHLRDVTAGVGDASDSLAGQLGNVQLIHVPVLDGREAKWVELGTGLVVLVGCLWVVWCLFAVAMRPLGTRGAGGRKKVV